MRLPGASGDDLIGTEASHPLSGWSDSSCAGHACRAKTETDFYGRCNFSDCRTDWADSSNGAETAEQFRQLAKKMIKQARERVENAVAQSEIKKIIRQLKKKRLEFLILEEYENEIQIVTFERKAGLRITKKGFDIISNTFFAEKNVNSH